MVMSSRKLRLSVHGPEVVAMFVDGEMGVYSCGIGVVVGNIRVGPGCVGGRKGVGVDWGAQAEASSMIAGRIN
jgi:hypothetical protein